MSWTSLKDPNTVEYIESDQNLVRSTSGNLKYLALVTNGHYP